MPGYKYRTLSTKENASMQEHTDSFTDRKTFKSQMFLCTSRMPKEDQRAYVVLVQHNEVMCTTFHMVS